jgi:hypothetical protein
MNSRQAKYWIFAVLGTIIIVWFWSILGHFLLPPVGADFWLFIFILSCIFCIAMLSILMYYLYDRDR